MQSLYSAFYKQPLQIHKKWGWGDMFAPGSLADKTSSTIYHMLNFVYKLLRNNSQQAFTVICMRDYKRCDKNICGLSSKELRNRSDPSDLKVAVWQPDVWIVGRIAKKVYHSGRFIEHQARGFGKVKEQNSILRSVGTCCGWSTSLQRSHSFACSRKENQCWNEELHGI